MLDREINSPVASSAGRLFDAAAALIGLYHRVEYEAQAPMKLEAIAADGAAGLGGPDLTPRPPLRPGEGENDKQRGRSSEAIAPRGAKPYAYEVRDEPDGLILDPTPTFRAIVEDISVGVSQPEIAARFHASFVAMLADAAETAAEARGIDLVALSGGTFQNRIVLEDLMDELERRDLKAIMHTASPPGDGCVALGQAAVAMARWQ
jgi:hydrogenase maturation protein HypF